MSEKFFKNTWKEISGENFPLDWYRKIFSSHHYVMTQECLDFWSDYRESQFWSADKWQEYVDKKFVNLVNYAYKNNEFYKNLYNVNGVKLSEIKTINDISKLPLIDKTALSMGIGELSKAESYSNDKGGLWIKTSGSTGARMSFICDAEQLNRRWAAWMRLFEWGGWKWGDSEMRFWYHKASTVKDHKKEAFDAFLLNRHFYDFDKLDSIELDFFISEIIRIRPAIITGYWEAIEAIAKYAFKKGVSLYAGAILPSTQILSVSGRKLVEKVFETKILDKYASAEFSSIGCQCNKDSLYHIQSENVFLEIMKDGKALTKKDGGVGEAVVTDLSNFSTPLIRYRVGDVLEATDQVCNCGKTLPVFNRPLGRTKNIIIINDHIFTEFDLAEFEFKLWQDGIAERIKFLQNENGEVTLQVCGLVEKEKLEQFLFDFFNLQDLKSIKIENVGEIDHFHGKRHRGNSLLSNIFNN